MLYRLIGLFFWIATFFVDGLQLQKVGFPTRNAVSLNSRHQRLEEQEESPLDIPRRHLVLSSISSAVGWMILAPHSSLAAEEEETTTTIILKGTVTLDADLLAASSSSSETTTTSSALYVTCRPNKPDNVPGAILSGTRGKPPPVLAARFENPRFPFDFELSTPRDLTIEGASSSDGVGGGVSSTPVLDPSKFWWNRDDLIVSARWDSDGVAATRSPDDLVGRGIRKRGDDVRVEVPLTGRGAFGKFATGGSKK
jgi:hypothetical protein